MHRYKIVCEQAGIREAYEFEDYRTEDQVRNIWLNDVSEKWGRMVALRLSKHVEVTELTDGAQAPANKRTETNDRKTRLPGREGWEEEQ